MQDISLLQFFWMRFARLPPLPLLPAFFWLPLFFFMPFRRRFGFLSNSPTYHNLENLKEPNIPKSRKSQYIENLKEPNIPKSRKSQYLENLKEPNIPKSRKSQYIENLKDPNKDLVVVLYVFNLIWDGPRFHAFI